MPHQLRCPVCKQPAHRHSTPRPRHSTTESRYARYHHLDGRPLCPTPGDEAAGPVWPVDPAAAPAPATPGLLVRPYQHPCRTAGTAIPVRRLALGPVLCDPDGPIDCAGTAATGGCPWRTYGPEPSTVAALPEQRGCWLDATAVQRIVVALTDDGHPLPHTVTGLPTGHLDPTGCHVLARWLSSHTDDLYALPAHSDRRTMATVEYASRWLAWAGGHGGGALVLPTAPGAPAATDPAGCNAVDWRARDDPVIPQRGEPHRQAHRSPSDALGGTDVPATGTQPETHPVPPEGGPGTLTLPVRPLSPGRGAVALTDPWAC